MKIPTTLKHKPVIIAEDYDKVDGQYRENSDAKGLTLGLAQWNDRGRVDVSAKVWRHTGEKWSRQSEELPMHRVIDLAILICRAQQYFNNASAEQYQKNPAVDVISFDDGDMNINVCTDNPMIGEDIKLFRDALSKDPYLKERLQTLASVLKDME